MSGIAGQEIILIIIIGLIVLGPKRLPQVANQVGSWIGQARRMTRMMKRQLEDEVNFDINKELGIDEHGNPIPSSTVASPGFVQDRNTGNKIDGGDGGQPAADEEAALGSEPAEELPDDYSPAHAAEEKGTGVGDETSDTESNHDELDAVLEAAREPGPQAELLASAKTAEPSSKEPA